MYANTQLNSLLQMDGRAHHIGPTDASGARSVQVEVVRLDDLLPEIERTVGGGRYFLKSDTQGYDLNVLAGAEGGLPHIHGLQVELALKPFYEGAPTFGAMVAAIEGYGYEPTGFFPVATRPDGTLVEVDCVARRKDA